MFTSSSGICVDSWVKVEGHRHITCEVVGDQAQLRFGGERSSGLTLVLTERALEDLTSTSEQALRALRAEEEPDGPAAAPSELST